MKAVLSIFLLIVLLAFGCKPQENTDEKATEPAPVDVELEQLEHAVHQYPDSTALYDSLINTLAKRGKFSEAASWANKLIDRGEDSNYYYWYVKGDLFRKGKVYDSAIYAYEAYLNKFPDDQEILLNLGFTYAEAGNPKAVEAANAINNRFPTREMKAVTAYMKGVYFNTIKKYSEARKWLDICLTLNYNYYEAYMEKGYSYYDEGKYKEAYESFNTLTSLNSDYPEAWYWKGKSDEALGLRKDAINNYLQAYTLDNTIVEAKVAAERLQRGE